MTVLIDPHLLVAPTTCLVIDDARFWQRVVDIAAADRVQIGHEAFHWVVGQLEQLGYPESQVDFGPPSFRRECQSAMERILSRVSRGREEMVESSLTPPYLGSVEAGLCIVMDATEHGNRLDALLSDLEHWGVRSDVLTLGERDVELLYQPDQEPLAMASAATKSFFSNRRIHVLGGSITESAIANIESELGLQSDAVRWIVSEKSKPARDVDKHWAGLDPARDVAVCITGRVSHAVSEVGEKAAKKRGLQMVKCASQGRLVDVLKAWAVSQNSTNASR
jgi:hypothetical protein